MKLTHAQKIDNFIKIRYHEIQFLFHRDFLFMIKMSLAEIAQHTQGTTKSESTIIQGISTDTRHLLPGSLYVAIHGEQFDGHDFITEAWQKGAAAALVNRPIDCAIPQIIVKDTLIAFGQISTIWRSRFSLPIIGVTGSNGKTTLKNMLASILRAACQYSAEQVLATEGNLNNNIGVPMMLCRLNATHRYAVIEMGMNHSGEIAYLTKLTHPQIAVITNAAEAHLEDLKDVAGVAKAKGEIFAGLPSNGTAILNKDDGHFNYWLSITPHYQHITFGLENTADISATLETQHTMIKTLQGNIEVKLPLLGRHNIMNALAATAAALALNIPLDTIKQGLEKVHPAPGRLHQYYLTNGTRVIDDTYNANPFSLQAAVNTLATLPGKKVLVVGDMKELGANAKELHATAGEKIRMAGIDVLYTLGDISAAASQAFGKDARHFTDRDELITALQSHLTSDTVILVKGSRSMRMEKIIAGIIPEHQLETLH